MLNWIMDSFDDAISDNLGRGYDNDRLLGSFW